MSLIEKGFGLNYEVHSMGLIKVGKAGKMDNGFEYPASVKVRTSNLLREYDEELGEVDKEELLEFKIPCETVTQVGELNRALRDIKHNGLIFNLEGGLPKKYDGDYATVTVTNKTEDLINYFRKLKPNEKKASTNQ